MRVACVGGCGATLVVKLPDETDDFEDLDSDKVQERRDVRKLTVILLYVVFVAHSFSGEKVVEEYKKMIQNGHKENCPWRNNACDGVFSLKIMVVLKGTNYYSSYNPSSGFVEPRNRHFVFTGPVFESCGHR
jgi:hypothetical protein